MTATLVNEIYVILTSGTATDYDVVPDVVLHGSAGGACSHSAAATVVAEGHLALAASRMPSLYQHCYEGLFEVLHADRAEAEAATENYGTKTISLNRGACLSCVLMLLNPELATGWNYRKKLIVANEVNATFELWLTAFVLKKRPQSSETFSHRRWVLTHQRLEQSAQCAPVVASAFAAEAAICETAARLYHSNYNAWSHRQWAFVNLVSSEPKCTLSAEEKEEVLLSELNSTERFCDGFVSDYSGFHYRQHLIAHIQDSAARLRFLLDELARVTKSMQDIGTNFESLWYHRRAIVHMLLQTSVTAAAGDAEQSAAVARTICRDERLAASALLAKELTSGWPETLLERHLRWLSQLTSMHCCCSPPATAEASRSDRHRVLAS